MTTVHTAPAARQAPILVPVDAARDPHRAQICAGAWEQIREAGISMPLRTVKHVDRAVGVAVDAGFTAGKREGYVSGWRWGVLCGLTAALSAVAGVLVVWAGVQP